MHARPTRRARDGRAPFGGVTGFSAGLIGVKAHETPPITGCSAVPSVRNMVSAYGCTEERAVINQRLYDGVEAEEVLRVKVPQACIWELSRSRQILYLLYTAKLRARARIVFRESHVSQDLSFPKVQTLGAPRQLGAGWLRNIHTFLYRTTAVPTHQRIHVDESADDRTSAVNLLAFGAAVVTQL